MELPLTFFIFVNFSLPVARHNLSVTKTFTSAAWSQASTDVAFREKYLRAQVDYMPFAAHQPDLQFISPFCLSTINNYRVEHDAEAYRQRFAPLAPSRLSATYAFGDYEACVAVSQKYGWSLDQVRRFQLRQDSLTRVCRVNMEVISLARRAYLVSSMDDSTREALWNHYWAGGGALQFELPNVDFTRSVVSSGEIWEFLIEGRLELINGSTGA